MITTLFDDTLLSTGRVLARLHGWSAAEARRFAVELVDAAGRDEPLEALLRPGLLAKGATGDQVQAVAAAVRRAVDGLPLKDARMAVGAVWAGVALRRQGR